MPTTTFWLLHAGFALGSGLCFLLFNSSLPITLNPTCDERGTVPPSLRMLAERSPRTGLRLLLKIGRTNQFDASILVLHLLEVVLRNPFRRLQ